MTETVLQLPEGTVTQPKKQFTLKLNRKGEVIQVFKEHSRGLRRQRRMLDSLIRTGKRKARLHVRLVNEVLNANPELTALAKAGKEGALEMLLGALIIQHNLGPKGEKTILVVLRRALGLPEASDEGLRDIQSPVELDAVA